MSTTVDDGRHSASDSDLLTSEPSASTTSSPLSNLVLKRHSIRMFRPNPVPKSLLLECLTLASHAPSNSNIQNWRLTLASGASRTRITSALITAASLGPPSIQPLPSHLQHFRSDFGHLLYGPQGYDIPRTQPDQHKAAQMRNYDFFEAPVIGIVSMDSGLGMVDAMSVGMFVQTFMLALVEKGLGSCLQVSVIGYPDVVRREFGLSEDVELLCGVAVGWPEDGARVNEIVVPREEVAKAVKFLD